MDPSEAQLVFLDELEKRLAQIDATLRGQQELIREIVHELAKDLRSDFSKHIMAVIEAVNKKEMPKAQSLQPVIDAIRSAQDENKGIKRINGTDLRQLARRMDLLISTTAVMSEKIDKLLEPKQWEYELDRYNITGPVKSIIAKQKT